MGAALTSADGPARRPSASDDGERAARWVFAAMVAALTTYTMTLGAGLYFTLDDWMFLGSRREVLADEGVVAFLLRPHNGNLMAGFIAWQNVMAAAFGLGSYAPWLVSVVAANVATVWVVRHVMGRLGVRPMIASVAAASLLVWAPLGMSLIWAPAAVFGIVTAMVVGHLLLVEHAGPVGRRDVVGAALSTVAVALHSMAAVGVVVVVGGLVLRRRWKAAGIAALPGIALAAWLVTHGRGESVREPAPEGTRDLDVLDMFVSPDRVVSFAADLVTTPLGWFAPGPIAAAVLVALVVGGARLGYRQGTPEPRRLIRSLVAFAALFAVTVTAARSDFPPDVRTGRADRYALVMLVLLAPIIALALQRGIDAASRGLGRWMVPTAAIVVAAVLASNMVVLAREVAVPRELSQGMRRTVWTLAAMPRLDEVPGDARVLGWLIDLNVDHVRRLRDDRLVPLDHDPTSPPYVASQARFFVRAEPVRGGDERVVDAIAAAGDARDVRAGCVELDPADDVNERQILVPGDGAPRWFSVAAGAEHVRIRARRGDRTSMPVAPAGLRDSGTVRISVDAGVEVVIAADGPATLCDLDVRSSPP